MQGWIIAIIVVMSISIMLAGVSLKDNTRGADCLMGFEIVIAFLLVVFGLIISAVIAITKFLL